MVFSRELYNNLPAKHQIFSKYIITNGGQVDFAHFKSSQNDNTENLGFDPAGCSRILAVSRLVGDKGLAIKALLDNAAKASRDSRLQCFVIGSGPLRQELEEYGARISSNTNGLVDIRFLGALRVTSDHLRQADLVVGQGRTVVEGIAAGVPSAVCGKDGYFGLIRPSNFHALALTNFTGRQLEPFSDLQSDLKMRQVYLETEKQVTYKLAYENYDVSSGAKAILEAFAMNIESDLTRSKLIHAFIEAWRKYLQIWLIEKKSKM